MDLGQDVGPGEGGPAPGDLVDGHACGVGEDLVGQVAGSQQRQIVAVQQPRYPGLRISSDVVLGALAPPLGHGTEGAVLLERPGLEGGALS